MLVVGYGSFPTTRPQNMEALVMGTPKRVAAALILGNPKHLNLNS